MNCGLPSTCGTLINCGCCNPHRGDCDNDPSTGPEGCEEDIYHESVSDDLTNCGSCGHDCAAMDYYCFQGDC